MPAGLGKPWGGLRWVLGGTRSSSGGTLAQTLRALWLSEMSWWSPRPAQPPWLPDGRMEDVYIGHVEEAAQQPQGGRAVRQETLWINREGQERMTCKDESSTARLPERRCRGLLCDVPGSGQRCAHDRFDAVALMGLQIAPIVHYFCQHWLRQPAVDRTDPGERRPGHCRQYSMCTAAFLRECVEPE